MTGRRRNEICEDGFTTDGRVYDTTLAVMTIFRKAAMDSPDPMNIDMKALITSENWGRIPDR